MGKNIALKNKSILAMLDHMVSMATHNALLNNRDLPKKVLISH